MTSGDTPSVRACRARWLSHCAEQLNAVEIDASHYRLQQRSTFERWAAAMPNDFRFTLKAHRHLTHVRRLRDPAEPIHRDRERAEALGERHGTSVSISHAADWPMWEMLTTDLLCVRLHGCLRAHASAYGRAGLRPWVDRIRRCLAEGAAPRGAALLRSMLDGR